MRRAIILIAVWLVLSSFAETAAQPVVVGGAYFADKAFPEFIPLWQEGWSFKDSDRNKLRYARRLEGHRQPGWSGYQPVHPHNI